MSDHWTDRAVALLNTIDTGRLDASGPLPDLPGRPARRRRRWPAAAAGVVVLLSGATAVAASRGGGGDTAITALSCELPTGQFLGQVVSGDPVQDCTAEWIREDPSRPVPPLDVYVFNGVSFEVQPASDPAPTDPRMRKLVGSVKTDARLNEFRDALNDDIAGPDGQCLTTAQARDVVTAVASRRGDSSVPVVEVNPADAMTRCAVSSLDSSAAATRVELISLAKEYAGLHGKRLSFVDELRTATACQTVAQARATVEHAAADAGLSLDPQRDDLTLTVIDDPGSTCARTYVESGSFVTIWGPS